MPLMKVVHGEFSKRLAWLRALLDYRGETPKGVRVKHWLLALLGSCIVAFLLAPVIQPVALVVPALALSVVLPLLGRSTKSLEENESIETRAVEYVLVAVGLTILTRVLFAKVLDGTQPFNSGDHQVMTARAEEFALALYRGEWPRWTHLLQGGDSMTDIYPFLSSLITAGLHALSPSGTPFLQSYSLFVLLTWWLRGFGAYYLARRFAGPPIAAFLAAASLFEVGHDVWDGVWHGVFFFGMTHNGLALTLALFPAALQVDALRSPTTPRLTFLTLTTALTCLSHPLGILYSGLALMGVVAAGFIARTTVRNVLWTAFAMGIGIALACFWAVPFLYSLSHMAFGSGVGGVGYGEAGKGLFAGSTPTTTFTGWVGFGVVAVLGALASRNVPLVAAAVLSLLCWTLPMQEALTELRVYSVMSGLLDGQPRRFYTILKTACLPCCAWLLVRAFHFVRMPSSLEVMPVVVRAVLLAALLMVPGRALGSGFQFLGKQVDAQLQGSGAERPHTGPDYRAVMQVIQEERLRDKSPTPWRFAVNWTRTWRHAAWGEGLRIGVPIVDLVMIPSNYLGFRPREMTARALAEWNVKFFITENASEPFDGAVERLRTRTLTLWENSAYDDDFVVVPEGVKISNLRIAGNDIEFDVSGAPAAGVDARVRCAWYTRWRADGTASNVRATPPGPTAKPKQDQLLVNVKNGRAVLRCDGSAPRGRIGWTLTLLGLVGFAVVARTRLRERTESTVRRLAFTAESRVRGLDARLWRRVLWAAGGIVLAGLVVVALVRGSRDLLIPPLANPLLSVAGVRENGESTACARYWWMGEYRCSSPSVSLESDLGASPRGDSTDEFARLWPGARVRIAEEGVVAELTYRRVDFSKRSLALDFQSYGAFEVTASVDGNSLGKTTVSGADSHTFQVPATAPRVGRLVLRIRAKNQGGWIIFNRL